MVAVSDRPAPRPRRADASPLTLSVLPVCDVRARAELGRERESRRLCVGVVWCVARSCVATPQARGYEWYSSYCM